MRLPLAALRRHGTTVLLGDSFTWHLDAPRAPAGSITRIEFRAFGDVVSYLRFWKPDAGAMADLRRALSRYRRGPVAGMRDDEVINALAAHVARRELVVVEGASSVASGTTDAVPLPAPPAARAAAPPPAKLAPRSAVPAPLAPILPLLEDMQIEGAKVLPEVLQTLEQLDLSMGKIELATVSLAPTASGVPAIASALRAASGSITTTLDGL